MKRAIVRVPLGMIVGAAVLSAAAVVLGVLSAMPIYLTPRVWAVAGIGGALSFVLVWLGIRYRWGPLTVAALVLVFAILVVPLAVPDALRGGPGAVVSGLGDGLAAVALGWKQLLTLTLPVGSYQAVLVPLLVVSMVSVALIAFLALKGEKPAPFAAIPALLPVAFGVVFGGSQVSDALQIFGVTVSAPREIALWLAACGFGAVWVAWTSGSRRRAALRLGRAEGPAEVQGGARQSRLLRAVSGAAVIVIAVTAGVLVAPLAVAERTVPRDDVDPQLVVREQTSPLAGYRAWKRDAQFEQTMFTVTSEDRLPERMRLAVLDAYDGVDFFVSEGNAGRYTRFPSVAGESQAAEVEVQIGEGYEGIWLPLASPLASPPSFSGERASDLVDSFYVNRATWSMISVVDGLGAQEGDVYEAQMGIGPDPTLSSEPAKSEPLVDLETMPQLETWLEAQELPATGQGLTDAIERLRARGYLSHSLTDGEGERRWLETAADEYGTKFIPSVGGHSAARVEQLFQQLNEQQSAAGEDADEGALVAGIGDDEQFAAAAALIARAMGFESRVVLGVRLGGEDAGVPGVPACGGSCTGQNLAAWIEVRGAQNGWAPLDVSPQVEVPPSTLERGEQYPEYPTVPEEEEAPQADPPSGSRGDTSEDDDEEVPRDPFAALWPVLRVIGLSVLALLLLAVPILFIPVAKRLRMRRRRAAVHPEERTLGAWYELVDGYVDTGHKLVNAHSRSDVAALLGHPSALGIAEAVDHAVYAREGVTDTDADEVWGAVESALADEWAKLGFWGRLKARYSLRSLLPGAARVRRRRRRASREQVEVS